MIVDIPIEFRKVEKINTSYKYLYVFNSTSSYLYGKKNEKEYYYSTYVPANKRVRVDIQKLLEEFPDCQYHAFMYDSRLPFSVFEYTNNDEKEIYSYDFAEVFE